MVQVLVHRCDVCYTNIEELPADSESSYASIVTLGVNLETTTVNVTLNFDMGEGRMICSRCRWSALKSIVRDATDNPIKLYQNSGNERSATSG